MKIRCSCGTILTRKKDPFTDLLSDEQYFYKNGCRKVNNKWQCFFCTGIIDSNLEGQETFELNHNGTIVFSFNQKYYNSLSESEKNTALKTLQSLLSVRKNQLKDLES